MEEILKFLISNKDALVFLLGSGFLVALVKWGWAYLRYRRQQLIPIDTFPFEVVKPGSDKVIQHLLNGSGDNENDALADFNIPYQIRQAERNVRQELERLLDEKRWVLILGRTGLGKTREAAELAQLLNHEGWTVLNLTEQDWLDIPRYFPKDKIGSTRKLLFFLDDLNGWMYRGQKEFSPKAEQPFQPLKVPRQERLLNVLEFYEDVCRLENIRVLATARDEKYHQVDYKISEWEKLEFEKYPQFWKRFYLYNLAEPEDEAIVELLNEVVPRARIQACSEDYPRIAQRNDRTFRNIVENLQTARNRNWSLAPEKFPETLDKTWSKRYQRAIAHYPGARYVYDAVGLLQSLNIALYDSTVAPTARMLAGGNWIQRICYCWQIYIALRYLSRAERILEPRDGQIEAKGQEIEVGEYVTRIAHLLLKLTKRHPQKLLGSLLGFSTIASTLERNEEALKTINHLLKLIPDFDGGWYNRGIVLDSLERYEEAIASYDHALHMKPDNHEAWYNRGIVLSNLERYEEEISSYDQALQIKLNFHQAWNNRGAALGNLGHDEEAIASYDRALQIKSDLHEAWFGRSNALRRLGRYEEAIASYDHALHIKPDHYGVWNNRGIALQKLERYEEAIASYDQALQIKPDKDEAWYNKACCYGLQGDVELAVNNLKQAIHLNPEKYRNMAKDDADFDSIRGDERFRVLLDEVS